MYIKRISKEPPGTPAVVRKRVRAPEAHREAILEAGRAGVTHGLLMRHFGSKEQLFLMAVPGPRDLHELLPGPPETMPERLVAYLTRTLRRLLEPVGPPESSEGTSPS
ncbi:TetR family transcriptional regulator [Streptomyces sp. NBC_00328]|uniref:TetR family transcriptional regulator n=1 Tax=Streptomyces sp. NBC_00328 TaxID=2903646 RepID=UPI002E27ABBA|nr:TetR family transcriptional regulator [Streptomyces sp. NBC_00328]